MTPPPANPNPHYVGGGPWDGAPVGTHARDLEVIDTPGGGRYVRCAETGDFVYCPPVTP